MVVSLRILPVADAAKQRDPVDLAAHEEAPPNEPFAVDALRQVEEPEAHVETLSPLRKNLKARTEQRARVSGEIGRRVPRSNRQPAGHVGVRGSLVHEGPPTSVVPRP